MALFLATLAAVLVPPELTSAEVRLVEARSKPLFNGRWVVDVRQDQVTVEVEHDRLGVFHISRAHPANERSAIRVVVRRVESSSVQSPGDALGLMRVKSLPDVAGQRFTIECDVSGTLDGRAIEPFTLGPYHVEIEPRARPVLASIVEDAMLRAAGEHIAAEARTWVERGWGMGSDRHVSPAELARETLEIIRERESGSGQ